MNFVIFCIYIPLVHSVSHKFKTTYNGINRKLTVRIQESFAETKLDEQQIYQYESDTGKLVFKQDWMRQFASGHRWEKYNEIRERVQQIYKINITLLMPQFNQSHGVHRYQRIYGCVWDDEAEVSDGFDEYSYNGKNFISLDLKEGRYTAHVPQAKATVRLWNNDRKQLDFLKEYYKKECIDWLKELLNFSKATLSGQSLTEPVQKNLTIDDTKTWSTMKLEYAALCIIAVFIGVIFILIALYWKYSNKSEHHKETKYSKVYPMINAPDNPPAVQTV